MLESWEGQKALKLVVQQIWEIFQRRKTSDLTTCHRPAAWPSGRDWDRKKVLRSQYRIVLQAWLLTLCVILPSSDLLIARL